MSFPFYFIPPFIEHRRIDVFRRKSGILKKSFDGIFLFSSGLHKPSPSFPERRLKWIPIQPPSPLLLFVNIDKTHEEWTHHRTGFTCVVYKRSCIGADKREVVMNSARWICEERRGGYKLIWFWAPPIAEKRFHCWFDEPVDWISGRNCTWLGGSKDAVPKVPRIW